MEIPEIVNTESTLNSVRCDACGCAFAPKILVQSKGEINFTFFRCDYCGMPFLISVTDEKLRQDIAKYAGLVIQNKEQGLSAEELQKAQELYRANIERAETLKQEYQEYFDDFKGKSLREELHE